MKVKVQDSIAEGMKSVTFFHGHDETTYLMPEALARIIETWLNAMHDFKHGILLDDKELVAMFKDDGDRNVALSELDDGRLTAFSVEDK